MKVALLALCFSTAALADVTCFVRNEELRTTEVRLAREVCVEGVKLQLDVFAPSKAVVNLSLDGVDVAKTVELKNGVERGNGWVGFSFVVERNRKGEMCDVNWSALATGTLLAKRDGSSAIVESVQASVSFSPDNCHAPTFRNQEISYLKLGANPAPR
jgi:hypothetical protein